MLAASSASPWICMGRATSLGLSRSCFLEGLNHILLQNLRLVYPVVDVHKKRGQKETHLQAVSSQGTTASHIKPPFQNYILCLKGSNSHSSTEKTESPSWSHMCEPEWNGDQEAHGWLSES